MNTEFEKIDKKRPFYLFVCLVAAFVVGLAYTWSVLQAPFISQMGGDNVKSAVVLCYTITVVCSTMSPSIFGPFIKKLGAKKTIALGSILFGLGYVLSGATSSMTVFYITFGLGTGIGSGLIYPTIMGYAATLFPDRQGLVSGVIAGVYGGASIIWSPLLAFIIEEKSLFTALLAAGITALAAIFAASQFIRQVPYEYTEYKKQSAGSADTNSSDKIQLRQLNRRQMVKTKTFYIALTAFAFGCTSGMMVISQVSSIMQESFALEPTQAAAYVSIMSFMSMIGRFLWGAVTDHFDKYTTLSIICGVPAVAMAVLSFASSMPVTVACLALTALCYGGFGSTITPITSDLFGRRYVSENYGVMYRAFGFAGLAGPQLAVKLSNSGNYSSAYLSAAAISLVALIMALVIRKIIHNAKNRKKA